MRIQYDNATGKTDILYLTEVQMGLITFALKFTADNSMSRDASEEADALDQELRREQSEARIIN